ncbi:MAG: hypothetical protein RIM99_09895 [Cyclobacteriaceae bacterium]
MKKYPFGLRHLLFAFSLVVLVISCQEDSTNEEITLTDEDMIAATRLAEDYLSINGRGDYEKAITVLKYKDDKLYYATNTDDIDGYQEVTEQTVTAIVEPGEHVFWYSGGGVTDLDGIEFDPFSQGQLVNEPEEINADKMWVIAVPEDLEDEDLYKYDIIYQFKGNDGAPIRLDPKIKITQD